MVGILSAISPIFSGSVSREAVPLAEVARTILVTLLMMWSVGAISIPRRHASTTELPALVRR